MPYFFNKLFASAFLFFLLPLFLTGTLAADVPIVLVSIAPHKFFVEKIAKNTVEVQLMVPAGASAHTYEPTPRQMQTAGKGVIWFRTGEPFETRAIQAIKSYRPALEVVDLREGLDLITAAEGHTSCGCCHGSVDLHFWLSTRQGIIQAKTIADALSKAFPGYANFYQSNLASFEEELRELDKKITGILTPLQNRNILVSHPAYAYFCRDYDLQQHAIEVEGRDPTPQQMTRLLNVAHRTQAKAIFIQVQYNNKAARLVAETIGARLVTLDPYSEHYISTMLEIAHAFAKQ